MKNVLLALFTFSFLNAFSNFTLPKNVWRFSVNNEQSISQWKSSGKVKGFHSEVFTLKNYDIKYFDHKNQNSFKDLNDLGDLEITVSENVQKIITDFDALSSSKGWGFQLYDFTENFFGPDSVKLNGQIFNTESKFNYNKIFYDIEFGISNKTTLMISIPVFLTANQNEYWSWNGMEFENGRIEDFLNYHNENKKNFEEIFSSPIKDSIPSFMFEKINSVYNAYYDESGEYSILWALNSGNDPFKVIYDSNYNPFSESIDSTSIDSIMNYFYPQRSSSGLGDIKLGVNFHLFGSPVWVGESIFSVYGGLGITIPSAKLLSIYKKNDLLIPNQFKELPLGKGLSALNASLFGEFYTNYRSRLIRFNWLIKSIFNREGKFNTRVSPRGIFIIDDESILLNLGDTYRMKLGNETLGNLNASIELFPKRLSFSFGQTWYYKNRDKYFSKNSFWNEWMGGGTDIHKGYDTKTLMVYQKLSLTFHNSYFSNQISSIPFELDLSLNIPIITNHNWHAYRLNLSFITFFQFW
tara:strand:+ start:25758 stop:27329 length:1572 start_codon:yes stop_codon:yes gene_type:complete